MFEFLTRHKTEMPAPEDALPGRDSAVLEPGEHAVLGTPMAPPFPADTEQVIVGMGCFWGAEKAFWQLPGVYTTAVGYSGGITPNPTYEEVCSGLTGQNEVVLVVYRPARDLVRRGAEGVLGGPRPNPGHAPGQRRGHPVPLSALHHHRGPGRGGGGLPRGLPGGAGQAGHGKITTEVADAGPFYYAEDYHQQYLHKVPNGYCGLGGTGVSCPVGLSA